MSIRKLLFAACLLFVICLAFSQLAAGEETTRFGAKITKAEFGETGSPKLEIPDGWILLEGDQWTGLNLREYYFTLESNKQNAPAPDVRAVWPNVKIAEVYGVEKIRFIEDGVEFKMKNTKSPTKFTTALPRWGAVSMCIFHNLKGVQAGYYRSDEYPENQVAAQLNWLFAAREMMREAGFTKSDKSIDGIINLYGFETNFPNGHVDYPPHFHIMTMWNRWQDIQATHFLLGEDGKILHNNHFVVENGKTIKDKCVQHRSNEDIVMTDKSGKVCFILNLLADGTGLAMRVPGDKREYKIASEDAVKSVTCFVRESSSGDWRQATISRVSDDVRGGILTVVTEKDGSKQTETWRYNPHTGSLLSIKGNHKEVRSIL